MEKNNKDEGTLETKILPKPKIILPKPISIEEIPVMPVLKPPILKINKENREEL